MKKYVRQIGSTAKAADSKSRGSLKYGVLLALFVLGIALVAGMTSSPGRASASTPPANSVSWTGQGSDSVTACSADQTPFLHWIFTTGGESSVTAATLTVSGTASGGGAMSEHGGSWTLDTPYTGTGQPTTSDLQAYVTYVGSLGSGNANLVISDGCYGTTTTTTTGTTTGETTTTETTTPTTTVTVPVTTTVATTTTVPVTTTVATTTTVPGPTTTSTVPGPTTTVTQTTPGPTQTVTAPTQTVTTTTPGPTQTVTNTVTVKTPGKTKVIVKKTVIVKKVPGKTKVIVKKTVITAPRTQGYTR